MLLINCEINLILTWSSTCAITNSAGAGRFAITEKILCFNSNFINSKYCTTASEIKI